MNWLCRHVHGFEGRASAREFAEELLRSGLIRHQVARSRFSEHCYYGFVSSCDTSIGLRSTVFDEKHKFRELELLMQEAAARVSPPLARRRWWSGTAPFDVFLHHERHHLHPMTPLHLHPTTPPCSLPITRLRSCSRSPTFSLPIRPAHPILLLHIPVTDAHAHSGEINNSKSRLASANSTLS